MSSSHRLTKLLVGDTVVVRSGEHRGAKGKILRFTAGGSRAVVEQVALVTRHVKPVPAMGREGGLKESESALPVSKLALVAADGSASRLGFEIGENGQKVRIARKSGAKV